jgi:toluene monooxygenase system ferredoxin subunit
MPWRPALREDQLWIGEMAGVTVDGRAVLLVNVDGTVRAYEDRCCHRNVPLSLGRLTGGRVICWAHEWEYDACTGAGLNPEGVALRRYEVRVAGAEIQINLDDNVDGG